MNKTLKIHLYLKTRSGSIASELPIYMRITVDGERVEFSTQRTISISNWDNNRTSAKGNSADARQLNSFLDSLRAQAQEAQRELLNKGLDVTAHAIKKILYGETESVNTICEVYEHVIQQVKALLGKDYAIGTYRRYKAARAALMVTVTPNTTEYEAREEFKAIFAGMLLLQFNNSFVVSKFGFQNINTFRVKYQLIPAALPRTLNQDELWKF